MKDHHLYKINWVNFPEVKRKLKGCYLIGNCYVGSSEHIRQRVLQHCRSVYSVEKKQFNKNIKSEKDLYISDCIKNNKNIDVVFISDNINDEFLMHEKYNIKPKKFANIRGKENE